VDVSREMGEHFSRRGYQRGSAFADLNNDGFTDIVVTSLGRRPAILINSGTAADAHWLHVVLTGKRSNRDSIGAWVTVTTAGGRVFHDWVSPSVGFLSTSDRRLHFGLGSETKVTSVEARWPSGLSLRMENVSVDRTVAMTEPD
jgi:enediyne biosynthesis protein E4